MRSAAMRKVAAGATVGVVSVVLIALPVAANPGTMVTRFDSWWQALLAIGIANFSVNLLLMSSLLHLIVSFRGRAAGEFSPSEWRFLGQILGASLTITICGAFVDFFVFYEPTNFGYETWALHQQDFMFTSLFLGSLLVAISVLVACFFVIRLKLRFSLITAVAMGIANLLVWVFTIDLALENRLLVPVATLFSALFIVPMYLLMRWHSKTFEESALHDEEVSLEDQRILRCNLWCLFGVGLAFAGWFVDEALYQIDTTAGDHGWFLILMAATLGFISPLVSGGFMLLLVTISDSAGIAGFGYHVSILTTLIILSSFAYPLGFGYEKRRHALDRLLTFRTIPSFDRTDDECRSAASGPPD